MECMLWVNVGRIRSSPRIRRNAYLKARFTAFPPQSYSHAFAWLSVSKKLLPPPFMGEVAERSEVGGGSHFSEKSGNFRIFAVQIFWLPPAFGHPPHK